MDSFPDTFMWGATLHSHSVEGDHFDSDWWRWEQRPGNIADGSNSQYAVDHWNRYADDIRLAREYGLNTLLITLEWSRIQPTQDCFDEAGLLHYREVLESCAKKGITPICALQHIALPQWMAAKGGWSNAQSPDWFRDYTKRLMVELGDLCDHWIPIHEPMRALIEGYQQGHWPPERRSPRGLKRAMHHQLEAHQFAYTRIKEHRSEAQVGFSVRATGYSPQNPYSAWDARVALREAHRCNHEMLATLMENGDKAPVDFIGVSHFDHSCVSMRWRSPGTSFTRYAPRTGTSPETVASHTEFASLLREYEGYARPIIITGNGCPHRSDDEQCGYMLDHVSTIREAMNKGMDIQGYVYHSLLNGFEWDLGYTRRYGLMVVDTERMTRSPNSIAILYKELCETGSLRSGTISTFCPDRNRAVEEISS